MAVHFVNTGRLSAIALTFRTAWVPNVNKCRPSPIALTKCTPTVHFSPIPPRPHAIGELRTA